MCSSDLAPPKKVKKTKSKTVVSLDQKKEKIKNQNPEAVPLPDKQVKKIETKKETKHKKGSRLNKKVLEVLNNVDHVVANSNFTKNLAIKLGVEELNFKLPIVIRFQGTNASNGQEIINKSNLDLVSVDDFIEAAKTAVDLSRKK